LGLGLRPLKLNGKEGTGPRGLTLVGGIGELPNLKRGVGAQESYFLGGGPRVGPTKEGRKRNFNLTIFKVWLC